MRTLTELASKAVGAAKAAGAALSGYRGIFRTLKREHGEISVLMMRVATDGDGDVRAQLFPLIAQELLSHGRAEDAELYSFLADHESTRGPILELQADHERIELLLAELASLPIRSSGWLLRFRELQRAVEEHVGQEESLLFPLARQLLSPELAEEIDRLYKIQKANPPA